MSKRTALLWAVLALALGTVSMTFVACGGDNAPTISGPTEDTNPVASNPTTPQAPPQAVQGTEGVCAGKTVYQTLNKAIGFCVLETKNMTERPSCLALDPDKVDEISITIGIVAPAGGYTRTGYFHNPENGCGATEGGDGGDPANNKRHFKDGDIMTFVRPISRDACGRDQWDGDLRDGTNRIDFLGYVLNYPDDCVTCKTLNAQLSCKPAVVESRRAETFPAQCTGSWKNPGTGSLDWGDSSQMTVKNPFTENHDYAKGDTEVTRTVNLTVTRDDLICNASTTIKIPPKNDTCEDFPPPPVDATVGTPVTTQTPTTFTVESIPVNATPAGVTGAWVPLPPQTTPRPEFPNPAGSLHFDWNWTLSYNPKGTELTCRASGSKPFDVSVPPQNDPCKDHFLRVKVKFDKNGHLGYQIQSSNAGTLTILGQTINFPAGTTGPVDLGDVECGKTVEWAAQTPCDQLSGEVESEECEETCELPTPAGLICHEPFGSVASECAFFGLVGLGKDDDLSGSSHTASRDAALVIVKDGRGTCDQGESAYRTYTNVHAGDVLQKPTGAGDISHVTYCGCPED